MTVTALTGTAPTQPAPPGPSPQTKGLIDSDFETFLKMLTTQLQNQDPLDPIDNSDYAVQLATFSGVEQQVQTNDLLQGLGNQLNVLGMSDLAGWVGKQARAEMPVWFDGSPVTVAATPAAQADAAQLVVRDVNDRVVARTPVPPDATGFDWTGTDAAGQPLPEGRYSLSLESYAETVLIETSPVESYAEIVEARGGAGTTTLLFPGGIEVAADRITALRAD